jgi:transcriptional regulator GlxA family with amidase domain
MRYVSDLSSRLKNADRFSRGITEPMIVDITIQTGFANQSHLTTQFRKIVGIASPAENRLHLKNIADCLETRKVEIFNRLTK